MCQRVLGKGSLVTENDAEGTGYRKPPKHRRFQPGQSGNPHGRPKGSRNFLTEIREELNSAVEYSENGHHVQITKQRAIIKSLIAKAMEGDIRAITALLAHLTPAVNDDEETLSPEDAKLLEQFERREARHPETNRQNNLPPEPGDSNESQT